MHNDNFDKTLYNAMLEAEYKALVESTDRLQKPESLKKVRDAFELANKAHFGVFRKTGYKIPYMMHPLAVARIVAEEMGLGSTTIAAALLHDVVEDTDYTLEFIKEKFGEDVAIIVDGVTKIENVESIGISQQADTFRNFILKMSEDKRIAFVKIADRLHNLRTISDMPDNNKMIKTAESFEVYAPLAHQLGLFRIKNEIEDLSFKNRFYDEYEKIKNIVDNTKDEREIRIESIIKPLANTLSSNNYKYRIVQLTKSYYKTWQIIKEKQISFNQINNFLTVRIVLTPDGTMPDKQLCYLIYSYLTDIFIVKDSSTKDWITHPKSNGFEALVTNVMHGGYWFEVQIMTERMHEIAEKGYAQNHDNIHLVNIKKWNERIEEMLDKEGLTNEQILDIIRPQDREIYVITPKGEIKTLPKGSTALDYAFFIHSDLGLHFSYAIVDKRIVSYDYVLINGQEVKVVSSDSVVPEKIWNESLFILSNRNILDNYFKRQKRKIINEGEEIFNAFAEKHKFSGEIISKIISQFSCANKEEFFYRISKKKILEEDILKKIHSQSGITKRILGFFSTTKIQGEYIKSEIEFHPKKVFVINNMDNLTTAICCNPIAGDNAIVHKKGDKFILHRSDCRQAKALNTSEGQNTTVVKWELIEKVEFEARIKISGIDRHGILSEVLGIISMQMNIDMRSLVIKSERKIFSGIIKLYVQNAKDLNKLISKIRKVKNIDDVQRK